MLDLKDENIFVPRSILVSFHPFGYAVVCIEKDSCLMSFNAARIEWLPRQFQHRVVLIKIKKKIYMNGEARTDSIKQQSS